MSERYPHKLAAVYPDAATAAAAVVALSTSESNDIEVIQLAPGARDVDRLIEPESEATRSTMVNATITGSAVGTVAGAAAVSAATIAAPTLFVSAPVVGPLVVLGYGAIIGAIPGAIRGLKLREAVLATLVKDALSAGYYVVVVHAADDAAEHRAQVVIDETMAEETAHS